LLGKEPAFVIGSRFFYAKRRIPKISRNSTGIIRYKIPYKLS